MFAKWSRCPHCRATLDIGIYGGGYIESKLGKPTISTCTKCGGKITDGKMPWSKMDTGGKFFEVLIQLFAMVVFIPLISIVVGGLLFSMLFKWEGSMIVTGILLLLIPWEIYAGYSFWKETRT